MKLPDDPVAYLTPETVWIVELDGDLYFEVRWGEGDPSRTRLEALDEAQVRETGVTLPVQIASRDGEKMRPLA